MAFWSFIVDSFVALFANKVFLSVLVSFLLSHILKVFVDYYETKKFTLRSFYRTGGMPSAHTATVVALTLGVFWAEGVSTLFIAVFFLSLIIVRDSLGVRYSVGEQAVTLNKLLKASRVHESVKVILGHTLSQVIVGAVIGAVATLIVFLI